MVTMVPDTVFHSVLQIGVCQVDDRFTHRSESAGPRPRVGDAVGGRRHDATVGDEHYILAAELLLQLTHQTLLDLVERLQQSEGHLRSGSTLDQLSMRLPISSNCTRRWCRVTLASLHC